MLKQRVITALMMLAVFLLALLVPSDKPFKLLMLLVTVVAAWEWAGLNKLGKSGAIVFAIGQFILLIGIYYFELMKQINLPVLWYFTFVVWLVLILSMLSLGVAFWSKLPIALRCLIGYFILTSAFIALITAYDFGLNYLLSIFALVWLADVCAYFAGRTFSLRWAKSKLAPSISPGKSWEGAWGAVLGVWLFGAIWSQIDAYAGFNSPSIFSQLMGQGSAVFFFIVLLLVVVSIVGDLFESLVKRSSGQKDSSNLLPGHGGVLDRIDAILPIFPVCLAVTHYL